MDIDYANVQPGAAPPQPKELSGDELTARYILQLADDAMVYSQRLGEWIANAPQIEEDMALANVALDLLGQVRPLYSRVGELDGTGRTEDDIAYFRGEREYYNVHLVEQECGDFADEMARMLWFSAYQLELYRALMQSSDATLAGVASKAVKEVEYHRDHATQWVLRLGDGTHASHERMQAALERTKGFIPEVFADDPVSVNAAASGVGVLPSSLREAATAYVASVVERATLTMPDAEPSWRSRGGREAVHSTPMGYLLAEMQHIARSHPGATW
ncbi:MAG: phenylacetate-CoA oxygenase subunit PaaC [Austwickia sp.]|nr:phenylacetate-CoA oxygenase subunit PaaC [Austwickia sp.]MBK9101428.1 phenylacetate-CoA oxygenase subunit PaaC [Austwickia sp.]